MRLNANYVINNDRIAIFTETTSWINLARINDFHTKEELLDLYKAVDKAAKDAKIKVAYTNHYKKTILDNYDQYALDVEKSHKMYDEMKQIAANVRVTPSTEYNPEMELLMKKRDEYSSLLYYGTSPYWEILRVFKELKNLKEEIARQTANPINGFFYRLVKIHI